MSHSDPSEPTAVKQSHSSISRTEHGFETLVFASRWIQAPLYGGLIVAELLYAYKFLVELWEMVRHINQQEETTFMLGVLGLIDVTMVIIGGYATFVSKLDDPHYSRGFVTKPPRRQARRARGAVREGGILEIVC